VSAIGVVKQYGAAWSVYVRIARLALEEKQVSYGLVEVDVFAKTGVPQEHLKRQPFGRIPAFEHDGFHLYETNAIVRYIDDAFPGCKLQSTDPKARAKVNQIVGILDAYATERSFGTSTLNAWFQLAKAGWPTSGISPQRYRAPLYVYPN